MRALRPSTRLAAYAPTLCAVVVAMCACASIQCRERHFVALTRTQICLRALCTDLRWVELRWTKLNCSWVYASSAAVGMIAFNVWTAGQCMSSHLHGYSPGLSNTVPHVFLFKFFFFTFEIFVNIFCEQNRIASARCLTASYCFIAFSPEAYRAHKILFVRSKRVKKSHNRNKTTTVI